ncbi:hypothetical protein AAC387_Pa11g1035 [Persea americana]
MPMMMRGMQPSRDMDKEDIIGEVEDLWKKMLSLAFKGEWDEVDYILTGEDSSTIRAFSLQPIYSSNDTLLHLAASEGQTEVVQELLIMIKQDLENDEMGSIEFPPVNVTRNTPLHLAAVNGHDETCRMIMEEAPGWEETMNEDGETPIFLAALAGAKEVFSTLTSMSQNKEIALRRRNDGDTILHCAVFGEYFDLASDIIERYSQLVHYRNEKGLTPLHILANTPDAFRSGWQLGYLDRAIYFSIKVSTDEARPRQKKQENYPSKLPANYYLCWTAFKLLRRTFAALGASRSPMDGATEEAGVMVSPTTTIASQSPRKQGGRGIANSFKRFFRNLLVAFLVILAFFGYPPEEDPAPSGKSQTDSDTHPSIIDARSYQLKEETTKVSPFLVAGMNGVKEMVIAIMKAFPEAIQDRNLKNKNIILLAAEHRQPEIYEIFLKWKTESWLGKVDVDGNTVLHLAAKDTQDQSLLIPGAALQMQRDIAWFKFVKESLPPSFPKRQNHKGLTAMEVFTKTHQELAKKWAKWLNNAAQSCSVVAALIIGVAFATVATVPGGLVQEHGFPVFHGKVAFNVFSVSSLLALCSSAVALIMFLGILTSPYQDSDFGNELTRKLIYGLASLFISIAAMFLSFFSGDLFVLDRKIKYMAYPLFIITTCGTLAGFPLYYEIARQMITDFPVRSYPNKLAF